MAPHLLNFTRTMNSDKTPADKTRKRTVSEILREAYERHCHDRVTRSALRQYLKR